MSSRAGVEDLAVQDLEFSDYVPDLSEIEALRIELRKGFASTESNIGRVSKLLGRTVAAKLEYRAASRRLRSQLWCLRMLASLALSGDQEHQDAARQLGEAMGVTTGPIARYRDRTDTGKLARGIAKVWRNTRTAPTPMRDCYGRWVSFEEFWQGVDMSDDWAGTHCVGPNRNNTSGLPNDN